MLFIVCRRMDVLDLCLKCLQLVLPMYTHTVTASWVLEKYMNLDFWFVLSSSGVNKKDVLWIHRRIHPSFFCSLSGFGSWGQPSEQRSPDFPQPNHLFQLIWGHWSVPKPVERCNFCSEPVNLFFHSLACTVQLVQQCICVGFSFSQTWGPYYVELHTSIGLAWCIMLMYFFPVSAPIAPLFSASGTSISSLLSAACM